jgi:GTP-binding protein
MITDYALITVRSGNGGKGCESFEHKSPIKLIPNGGNGGDGGSVIICAERNIDDLSAFRFKHIFEAENGSHGSSNKKEGRKGKDITIYVPCGTSVWNHDKEMLIRDLTHSGDSVIVVRGGKGGRGNSARRSSMSGEPGTVLQVGLDFKFVADVFLIGLPNCGKSSLLSKLTGANVKVTDYPFSTTVPHLGVLETPDFKRLVLCELPSLAENASEGKGLGNDFLKHLDRAKLIVWVLDPTAEMSVAEQMETLQAEVEAYDESFQDIPSVAVVTKSDLLTKTKPKKNANQVICSSLSGDGLESLKKILLKKCNVQ